MRKNEDFQEESSRSSASSRSSSSSESSSDEEEKGNECFLENDQFSVEKDLLPAENDRLPVENDRLPIANDQLPVEPEVTLTDCIPLVLAEIDSESNHELNDQESLPVTLDKPEFTSEVEFILSPILVNEEVDDTSLLPVLDFFPKVESEFESQASMESEVSIAPLVTDGPVMTTESKITNEPEVAYELNDTTEPEVMNELEETTKLEVNTEPEIQLNERSSLVLADIESSSGEESDEEPDDFRQLPVLSFIQKPEPEILKISQAECEEELHPFVPMVDEFNNLVPLPVSNFKLSSGDEPEVSVEQLEVESVGGPSLTARRSARKSSTDDELTDSKSLPFLKKPYSKETPELLEKPEISGLPEVTDSNEPIEPERLPILSFIQITDSADDSEVFDELDSMTGLGVSERPEVPEKPEVRNADEPSSSAQNGSCTISARFFLHVANS